MHFACNAFDAASKFHLFDIRIVCQHQLQPPAGKNSTKLVILYRFVNVVKLRILLSVQKTLILKIFNENFLYGRSDRKVDVDSGDLVTFVCF